MVIDNGTPHGFLNMCCLCDETREATNRVYRVLEKIIKSDNICK